MPAIVVASIIGAAATGGTAYAASRSQKNASRRAEQFQLEGDERAMTYEQQQEEQRRAEAARVAEEDKRRFDIEEANRQKQAEIAEAERIRNAENDRWNQERLAKLDAMSAEERRIALQREAEREARLAPYRKASQEALGRLQGIITAPGAGTSPAAHQFSRPSTMRDLVPR
jgi:hypothetical protein